MLDDHMARYLYSPMGALRWKSDVAEYAQALRAYGVHTVRALAAPRWAAPSWPPAPAAASACCGRHTASPGCHRSPAAACQHARPRPQVNERIASLQSVVNVLVVAPESLLGLVNGGLRLDHREALRYIALREDFKTARVEGRTLQQLFSAEGLDMAAMPRPKK
jgi:hypothetical protein